MKTVSFIVFILLNSLQSSDLNLMVSDCDVKQFYEAVQPDTAVKVITSADKLEEVKLILVPYKMKEGTSFVEITRKGSNIYQIDRTKYYIETRHCNEYANFEKAILIVENNLGYTKGKIIFK